MDARSSKSRYWQGCAFSETCRGILPFSFQLRWWLASLGILGLWQHHSKLCLHPHTSLHLLFSFVLIQLPSCVWLFETLMDCSTPVFLVLHYLPEFAQTHVHWVSDAIQPSHPLSSPSLPTFNHSLHQGLFQWVDSLHEVAKVLEFQLQHQSFKWIFRTDFL